MMPASNNRSTTETTEDQLLEGWERRVKTDQGEFKKRFWSDENMCISYNGG